MPRRQFLAMSSAGLLLGLASPKAFATGAPRGLVQRFLEIDQAGWVTVYAKHLDMGQGIWSGLASILAEELDADWSRVRVVGAPAKMPDYAHTVWGAQTTGGSTSIANSWEQMRLAGATARAMLVQAAATAWHAPPEAIEVRGSVLRWGKREAGFGALAAAAGRLPAPKASPKPRADYRLLGRPLPQLDARAKSSGQVRYGIDGSLPGMKIAVIARPPRIGGRLIGYDTAVSRLPGVVAVVEVPGGVAIVADNTWQAIKARGLLQARWEHGDAAGLSSEALFARFDTAMAKEAPTFREDKGDPQAAFHAAANVVEARFEFPYLAHAPMETPSVSGVFTGGRCAMRAGFQSQTLNQGAVAEVLGIAPEQVTLDTVPAGGSFGRRAASNSDWVVDLAQILKATGGRWPIKLVRTREDDIGGAHYRPQTTHVLRGGLDAGGKLVAIEQRSAGQGVFPQFDPKVPEINRSSVLEGNATALYSVPNTRLSWWRIDVPVTVETYRGISNNHECVAKEIFIDRMARAAGADPVAFRLALLGHDPRQQAVLRLAAEKIGWDTPPLPGRWRGVSVHTADASFVAQIAEVSGTTEAFRIERIVAAIDVGLALNPDTLRSQVEGGIGFGLSSALYGGITFEDGAPVQRNFDRYRMMRMHEMPREIEVHIVESDHPPTGIGEPGSVVAPAAVINALERMGMTPVVRFPVIGEAQA